MAQRDYKQRSRHGPRKPVRQRSPWLYFAAGMLTGVAATLLVYFNEFVPVPLYVSPPKNAAKEKPTTAEKPKEQAAEAQAPKPKFEFYTMLPEMEVAIPDVELKRESQPAPDTPAGSGSYYLQAGSFRRPAEAEKMKASLAFLGLESKIQTVAINGADTWHRVRIGPFSDLASLNEARQRLRENKIESIVLKVRG